MEPQNWIIAALLFSLSEHERIGRTGKRNPIRCSYSLISPIWKSGVEFVYFGMSSVSSCACGTTLA